jgi:hypothetical protein
MTEVSLPVGAGSTAHQAAQTLASGEQTQPISLRWTRRDWAVLVGLALLVILFHWRLLTPNPDDRQSYGSGDFVHQFWAFSTFEARELSAGRLPLWNPYTYAGSPFWADVAN